MRRALTTAITTAILIVGARTVVQADSVTDCAAIQGKAVVAFYDGLFKEAARACGQGSAGNPLAVSQATAGKIAGKLYAAVGKGVDKNGAASCYRILDTIGAQLSPGSVLGQIRGLANTACLVTP